MRTRRTDTRLAPCRRREPAFCLDLIRFGVFVWRDAPQSQHSQVSERSLARIKAGRRSTHHALSSRLADRNYALAPIRALARTINPRMRLRTTGESWHK